MKETSDTGPGPDPGGPIPFQRYVEARRIGAPVTGQPMPANAAKYSSPATRVATSLILLALVMAGIFYLSRNAREQALQRSAGGGIQTLTVETEGNGVGAGQSGSAGSTGLLGASGSRVAVNGANSVANSAANPAANPAATGAASSAATGAANAVTGGANGGSANNRTANGGSAGSTASGAAVAGTNPGSSAVASLPAAKHYPVAGGQFVDASEDRPPGPKIKGVLQPGDMVTIMPRVTRGWGYLYFIVYEPNNQLRLSRVYDAEILKHTAPPLKFTVRHNSDGPFQVLMVASEDEIKSIQVLIQQANLLKVSPDRAREARFDHLLKALGSSIKSDAWSYKLLPELKYSQKV